MYDIKTLFIDRVLNKEHFYGKLCSKYATKVSSILLFYLGKWPKVAIA